MTSDDKRIAELVAIVDARRDQIKRIEEGIAYKKRYRMGRGAADDRVGLYYAECELEVAQLDLADELIEEARAMDMERAA